MPALPATNSHGGSDAYSGLGDFGDRDGLDRAGGGPDVRSGLSGLPARVGHGSGLLRMQLHVAAPVQRVGIGPRGWVHHQSVFCGHGIARRLSEASPHLLKARQLHALKQHYTDKLRLADVKEMFEQMKDHA
jgi:hypothetical protein